MRTPRVRFGIRLRSTLAATAVVGLALTGAGVAVVTSAHARFASGVDATATTQAEQIAAALSAGGADQLANLPLPGTGESTVAQVLDQSDQVVAATPGLSTASPVSPLRPAAGETLRERRSGFPPQTAAMSCLSGRR